jgi:hypothetical protein
MMKYAGVGSRATPEDILRVMEDFAYSIASVALLRSGAAQGADLAFEFGTILGGGRKEIYLPWKGFNGCINGELLEPTEAAFQLAAHYHPGWDYLNRPVQRLIARNGHQVLGKNLDDPVEMVVCWTPDGSLDGSSKQSGGTGQALRIAHDRGIKILNLKNPDHLEWIRESIADDGIL